MGGGIEGPDARCALISPEYRTLRNPFSSRASQFLIRAAADAPAAPKEAIEWCVAALVPTLPSASPLLFWEGAARSGEPTCALTWALTSSRPAVVKAVLAKIPAGSPSEALLVDHVVAWLACGTDPSMVGLESLQGEAVPVSALLAALREAGRAALLPRLAARLMLFVGAHVMLGTAQREGGPKPAFAVGSSARNKGPGGGPLPPFHSPFSRELTSPPGFLAEPWQLFLLLRLALELEGGGAAASGAASLPGPLFVSPDPATVAILHPCSVWPTPPLGGRTVASIMAGVLPGFEATLRFVAKAAPASLNALAPAAAGAVPASALHLAAAEEGWLPLLSALLTIGGSAVSVDVRDGEGATALHYAARRGNLRAAELLVAANADIQAKDSRHSTPAEIAQGARKDGVAQFLKGLSDRLKKQREKAKKERKKGKKEREGAGDAAAPSAPDAAGPQGQGPQDSEAPVEEPPKAPAAPVFVETPEAARLRHIRESIERIVGAAREHGGLLNVPIRSDAPPQPLPSPAGGDGAEDSSSREGAADAPPQVDASYWDEWDGGGSSSDESEDGLLGEAPPLTPGPKESGRKTDLASLLKGFSWEVLGQGHGGASHQRHSQYGEIVSSATVIVVVITL